MSALINAKTVIKKGLLSSMIMKNSIIILMLIFISCTSYETSSNKGLSSVRIQEKKNNIISHEKEYEIGDRGPAGGWVFYDKGVYSDGWRYLEAAPKDQSSGICWYSENDKANSSTDNEIGKGKSNTQKIFLAPEEGGKNVIKLCLDYRGGGKSDWFLPSIDELELMYNKLHKNGFGKFYDAFHSQSYYWSSSISFVWGVYSHNFNDGGQITLKRIETFKFKRRVRAIRSF